MRLRQSCVCFGGEPHFFQCDRLMTGLVVFVEEDEHCESSGGRTVLHLFRLNLLADIYTLLV